jgi:mitochondrial fission protein ELM1
MRSITSLEPAADCDAVTGFFALANVLWAASQLYFPRLFETIHDVALIIEHEQHEHEASPDRRQVIAMMDASKKINSRRQHNHYEPVREIIESDESDVTS